MKQTTLTKLSNWPLCAFLRTMAAEDNDGDSISWISRENSPPLFGRRPVVFLVFAKTCSKSPPQAKKNGVQNGWTIFRPPPWPLQSKNCESNFWVFSQSIMQNLFWRRVPDTVVYFFVFSVIFFSGFGSFQWYWQILFYFCGICR